MSTKCIVLGEDTSIQSAKKPIEFVKQLYIGFGDEALDNSKFKPSEFATIELVSPKRIGAHEYDVMFAYSARRSDGLIFLGFWNDGVV